MIIHRMADHDEQRRQAGGYFLIGLGAPIAAAFIYPLVGGSRHRGPMIDWQALSPQQLTVFLVGAAVGIAMLTAGIFILRRR